MEPGLVQIRRRTRLDSTRLGEENSVRQSNRARTGWGGRWYRNIQCFRFRGAEDGQRRSQVGVHAILTRPARHATLLHAKDPTKQAPNAVAPLPPRACCAPHDTALLRPACAPPWFRKLIRPARSSHRTAFTPKSSLRHQHRRDCHIFVVLGSIHVQVRSGPGRSGQRRIGGVYAHAGIGVVVGVKMQASLSLFRFVSIRLCAPLSIVYRDPAGKLAIQIRAIESFRTR